MLKFYLHLLATHLLLVHLSADRCPCEQPRFTIIEETFNYRNLGLYQVQTLPWMQVPSVYVECSFRGLTSIPKNIPREVQSLNMERNVIWNLTKHDFKCYSNLIFLSLAYNCNNDNYEPLPPCPQHLSIEPSAFKNLIFLKSLSLTGNALNVFPQDLPSSLEILVISETSIPAIRKKDVAHLSKLKMLFASYIELPSWEPHFWLDNDVFFPARYSLNFLEFQGAMFPQVPSNIFTPNLLGLDLSQIKISVIRSKAFIRASQLQLLVLENVVIDDMSLVIEEGAFDNLVNLTFLDLSLNAINFLPDKIFIKNVNLKNLDLSFNCLWKYVADPKFVTYTKIESLYLGFNLFCEYNQNIRFNTSFILGESFRTMKSLKRLSFGRPSNSATISTQPYVETFGLYLYHVTVSSLDVIKKLPFLAALNLDFCHVHRLDKGALLGFSNITSVTLSHNNLEDEKNSFSGSNISRNYVVKQCNRNTLLGCIRGHCDKLLKEPIKHEKVADENQKQIQCDSKAILDYSVNRISKLYESLFDFAPFTHWLDLSSNLIQIISNHDFNSMPLLCHIDLRSNPITSVGNQAFLRLSNLQFLFFNSTQLYTTPDALAFLQNLNHLIDFEYTYSGMFLFSVLLSFPNLPIAQTEAIDFSGNFLYAIAALPHEPILRAFPFVYKIVLQSCELEDKLFHFNNYQVTYLDVTDNLLTSLSIQTLRNFTSLKTLLFSKNKMQFFDSNVLEFFPKLEILDFSFNKITHIIPGIFESNFSVQLQLKHLSLFNNYITNIGPDVIPLSVLQQLTFLDLRFNALDCDCHLNENFGFYFKNRNVSLDQFPGFFSHCTTIIDKYYGGCVQCLSPHSLYGRSLSDYSSTVACSNVLCIALCIGFTTLTTFLMFVSLLFSSKKWKICLAKYATKSVRSNITKQSIRQNPNTFVHHGFVVYDQHNAKVGDWVENVLIPNLCNKSPYYNLGVVQRDVECGSSPLKQILHRIEASRKVIMVLSGDYSNSHEGKYLISVIEHLEYESGLNRSVWITFENDIQAGGLIRRKKRRNETSMLQVPESADDLPIFWSLIRELLKCV